MTAADEPLSAPPTVRDEAKAGLDPATYSMTDYLAGIRPTRRSVRLHLRADLLAALDEIVAEIDATEGDVDHLVDRYEQVRAEFFADHQTWVIEGRSSDWVKECWRVAAARLGVTLDARHDTTDMAARAQLIQHQLAGQVVEVKDADGHAVASSVTVADLEAIRQANEGEWNRLVIAMMECDTINAGASEVLTRDFSRRYSTGRSGTAS